MVALYEKYFFLVLDSASAKYYAQLFYRSDDKHRFKIQQNALKLMD